MPRCHLQWAAVTSPAYALESLDDSLRPFVTGSFGAESSRIGYPKSDRNPAMLSIPTCLHGVPARASKAQQRQGYVWG